MRDSVIGMEEQVAWIIADGRRVGVNKGMSFTDKRYKIVDN